MVGCLDSTWQLNRGLPQQKAICGASTPWTEGSVLYKCCLPAETQQHVCPEPSEGWASYAHATGTGRAMLTSQGRGEPCSRHRDRGSHAHVTGTGGGPAKQELCCFYPCYHTPCWEEGKEDVLISHSWQSLQSDKSHQRLQERQMTRTQSKKKKTNEQNLSHEIIKPNPGAGNSPPQARPVLHGVKDLSEIAVDGLMCFHGSLWSDSSVLRQLCPSVLPFPNTSANKT